MDPDELHERLSQIKTHWSLVFQMHHGPREADPAAPQALLMRYYGAVYRYLRGMLRDPDAAQELTQEFAVRILRGDFKHADPQRGRFRDFLKTAVRHLVIDYWRRREREKEAAQPLPVDSALGPAAPADENNADAEFLASWREELLLRAWEALAQVQQDSGGPYYTVLHSKSAHPEIRSAEMAARLTNELGKPFTEAGVRQLLHRARDKFAELLLEEVARSLPGASPAEREQELIELGLLDYCKSPLKRQGSPG
jgi:RNA polymerase sigma-70 factor (ECF subfamily)